MKIKKVLFIIILSVAIIFNATTALAENAGEKSVTNSDDDIIPTNGYLDYVDAAYFLLFVFNDAGAPVGNLTDSDIIDSDFYRMCTGQLEGTDKEIEVIKTFCCSCTLRSTDTSSRDRLASVLQGRIFKHILKMNVQGCRT